MGSLLGVLHAKAPTTKKAIAIMEGMSAPKSQRSQKPLFQRSNLTKLLLSVR